MMSIADERAKLILYWLEHTLKLKTISFEAASTDASFRRYFRIIHDKGQHIIMDAPPEKENIKPFIRIAALLKSGDIHVPDIIQQDTEQGFLLLEDFGSTCFLDQLTRANADHLYRTAFDSLYKLQHNIDTKKCQLPYYDEALLRRELDIFYDWFLSKTTNTPLPEAIKQALNKCLINSALEQPQVCVHRDFHSRNLMFLSDNSPGVIDFQDAVVGPVTYDLVSLLRDCYIIWPEEKVQAWMHSYFNRINASGFINTNIETFDRWFDLMGLQRHLKAIGIFSRLHLRDNKSGYLADIPRTLEYVKLVCNKYPELSEFNRFLTTHILPNQQ